MEDTADERSEITIVKMFFYDCCVLSKYKYQVISVKMHIFITRLDKHVLYIL